MGSTFQERVKEAVDFLKEKVKLQPSVMVILGSGLSSFVDQIQVETNLAFSEIPNFPQSNVAGHAGRVLFGSRSGVPVVVMQGRAHYYEGYDITDIAFAVHVFHLMGCKTLIVTNASGGINTAFTSGDIMLITDHINFMGTNPLRGIGPVNPKNQFPDMTNAYTKQLQQTAINIADSLGINLREGVYLGASGPNYETKAEIKIFRQWGADAVGMSTVPEVIVANYHRMQVLGLSCIANLAADMYVGNMNHAEILKNVEEAGSKLAKIIGGVIDRMGNVAQPQEAKTQ